MIWHDRTLWHNSPSRSTRQHCSQWINPASWLASLSFFLLSGLLPLDARCLVRFSWRKGKQERTGYYGILEHSFLSWSRKGPEKNCGVWTVLQSTRGIWLLYFFFTCVLIYRLHYCTMSWDFISNLFHKIWCFLNIQVCVLGSGLTKSIFPFLKESRVGEMVLADLPEVPTG